MVRNKPAPQQLNEVQQRRAQWNMLDGPGPAHQPQPHPQELEQQQQHNNRPRQQEEEEEDDIVMLLNDDLEEEEDDDDVEFIPGGPGDPGIQPWPGRWGGYGGEWGARGRRERHRRRNYVESDSDDEVVILEAPRQRRERVNREPDYGEFAEVLNRSQFYTKILRPGESDKGKNNFCCFGNVVLKLCGKLTGEELCQIPGFEFWLYVSPEADQSAIYFEWNSENSEGSPKKSKVKKKSADNFRFFMIEGMLDVELWQGMSTQRYFDLRLETYDDTINTMTIGVYLKRSGLSELKHPSESILTSHSLGIVVAHFFGVKVEKYEGEKNLKHDLEELYTAIKEWHSDREYCSLDVQHPSLIPQLRPYQKLAVKWMLHQEKFGQDVTQGSKNDANVDLKLDGNANGEDVKPGSKDGDSLDKTGSIGNANTDRKDSSNNVNLTQSDSKDSIDGNIKIEDGGDLHCLFVELTSEGGQTLYFNKYGGFLVKNKPFAVLPTPGGILADEMGLGKTVEVLSCMLCHPRSSVPKPEYLEPIVTSQKPRRRLKSARKLKGEDIYTLEGEEKEEVLGDGESVEGDKLKESFSTDSGISSMSEQEASQLMEESSPQEEESGRRGRSKQKGGIKVHLPKVNEEESDLNKSGRPKRRASKVLGGYASAGDDSEEEEDEYEPPEKKKRKTSNKTPAKNTSSRYCPDKEIADCPVWSSIESAIINESWNGNVKEYKKNGSYKEFRKFLRMRKKDPYYMMSLRERLQMQYNSDMALYSAREEVTRKTIQGFFDTKVEQKSFFECICGSSEIEDRDEKLRVQCGACSLWQHAECVQYNVSDPYRGPYFCPHCWTQEPPVVSGATLIVSPSSISYQWVNEIMKHLKQKSIRMLVYKGVASQGYMQPVDLAKFDIVITTYETLSRELNYVDLPHSNSQLGRRFRHPKRFMATPSPLPCVEWWRVCLDEAQMVECTTTKTAEMALRLAAVNRWCVTGTPVQKIVNELQGLLMFLGVDPYWVAEWWNRCLFLPYCHGVKQPLHHLLAQYMWRNAKKDVIHQIDIPLQSEEVHWLTFTRVEEHFYQRLHAECSYDAQQRLKKFPDENTKLSSLDRQTLNSVLQPLLKLRQACNHPQVVRGQFLSLNRKTMTMEMLLDNLIKRTKLEAEEAHRQVIAAMNGLAAIHIINNEWSAAVDMYRAVLHSIQDHPHIKTDSLQRLHTLHNLAEILEAGHSSVQPTLRDASLREEAEAIRTKYLQQHPQQVDSAAQECGQNTSSVQELEGRYNKKVNWWLGALQSFDNDFVMEVRDEMLNAYTRFEEHKCILFPVRTRTHLQMVLNAEMKKLKDQRLEMINGVQHLQSLELASLLDGAIDCHLRPVESEPPQCLLCATHEFFEDYEKTLFSMQELKHSRTTEKSKETEDVKDKAQVILSTRRGNWGQSELERILRYLQTKALEKVEECVYDDSKINFQVLDAMKKEFKNYRILWRAVFDSVSAMDEVNMATIRLRVRFPDEEVPQTKKKKEGDNLEKKVEALRYVMEPSELPQQELKLKSDRIVHTNEMKIKLGQLLYLQNLAKTDFGKDGGKNPEPCPICQGELGEKWAVLGCGHSYCMECMRALTNRGLHVKCPMCRHPTRTRDIFYVDTKAKQEEEIKVQGSLSTKMEGVVRLMLRLRLADPDAKVLVFSSWGDVLDVIGDAFAQNGITYRSLHHRSKFHRHLASFKNSNQITALLLPISSGSNGLNLVEARHVILVEPILNPAAELQAIGRVHRIGQTRQTTIHRFLVQDTIEHRMHDILRHHHDDHHHTDQNTVTIGDLKKLFLHPEELELQREIALAANTSASARISTADSNIADSLNDSTSDIADTNCASTSNIDASHNGSTFSIADSNSGNTSEDTTSHHTGTSDFTGSQNGSTSNLADYQNASTSNSALTNPLNTSSKAEITSQEILGEENNGERSRHVHFNVGNMTHSKNHGSGSKKQVRFSDGEMTHPGDSDDESDGDSQPDDGVEGSDLEADGDVSDESGDDEVFGPKVSGGEETGSDVNSGDVEDSSCDVQCGDGGEGSSGGDSCSSDVSYGERNINNPSQSYQYMDERSIQSTDSETLQTQQQKGMRVYWNEADELLNGDDSRERAGKKGIPTHASTSHSSLYHVAHTLSDSVTPSAFNSSLEPAPSTVSHSLGSFAPHSSNGTTNHNF